jgi:fermentation-respiration switch protein FrsA (DUF1100 family)
MHSWILKAVYYGVLVTAVVVITSLIGVYVATHPRKRPSEITPADLGLDFEELSFRTSDNLTLRGWFLPAETNKTIIVLHGYPFNKANILQFTKFLHPDFQLFLFDFRAQGDSEGTTVTGGMKERHDLRQAIQYLKTRKDVGAIGVYGFSMGASVAIMGSTEDVKAIVADSGFSSLTKLTERMFPYWIFKWPFVLTGRALAKALYGIDTAQVMPKEDVRHLRMPILFIHGKADTQVPYTETEKLFRNANKPKELWLIEGADHGNMPAEKREEYEERVSSFFKKNLK